MASSHKLQKEIQKARPSLRTVTPLAHWILVIYSMFNLILGISLFFAIDQTKITAPLLIVNEFLTYRFWGIVFIILGVFKLVSLKTNNWNLSRKSLLVGVSIKAAWAIALIVRSLTSPGTWLVTIMWLALALVQIVTFIFFMPPSIATDKQTRRKGIGDE